MAIRVAINGAGRVGRAFLKIALEKDDLEVVALNNLSGPESLAHLLKYDTVYGIYNHEVSSTKKGIIVDKKEYPVFSERDPADLPWQELGVDVVIESTGIFRTEEKISSHFKAGAKRVVLSAPAKGGNIETIIMGVNDDKLGDQKIISNASCTTNCIAPVVKILNDKFGVQKALMTTIHSYTADQNLIDGSHKDFRRARAAAVNIVPTTTGAAKATTKTIPDLEGKFDGMAIRVPTPDVSLSDLTFLLEKKATIEEINNTFIEAKKEPRYKKVLDTTDEPLVSTDFVGNPYATIVDLSLTNVIDGDLVKVIAWYDNEWGYAEALVRLCQEVGKKL